MIKGVDVSGWNNLEDIDGYELVMIKATEGVDFKSDMLDSFFNRLAGNDDGKPLPHKRYGFYHYARPEYGNSPAAEAAHFVQAVGHHANYGAFALDWEGDALAYGQAWALQWLEAVRSLTGAFPMIYMSASTENTGGYNAIRDKGYPLWVAHWGVTSPTLKHWNGYTLWQYTDKPVDLNYCQDDTAWRKAAPFFSAEGKSPAWKIASQEADKIVLEKC